MEQQLKWASTEEVNLLEAIHESMDKAFNLNDKTLDPNDKGLHKLIGHALKLLTLNPDIAQSLFNTFLYYFEREHGIVARQKILFEMSTIICCETGANNTSPSFRGVVCWGYNELPQTTVLQRNIELLSYLCGPDPIDWEVRNYLYKCIESWIRVGIVVDSFLQSLQQVDKTWKYSNRRPTFGEVASSSPPAFDLVMLGVMGNGCKKKLSLGGKVMWDTIQDWKADGLKDKWMYLDENGHHKVKISPIEE